jgi:quercetin dioxygenase-like cupin family protein
MVRPYTQEEEKGLIIRSFSEDSADDEFVWHRDDNDREVTVISGEGWMFQTDNGLPALMIPGETVCIPKDSWHRIIKGTGNLLVSIREMSYK